MKRILSLILSMVVCLSLFNGVAFATEDLGEDENVFQLNKSTVASTSNIDENNSDDTAYVTLQKGQWFDFVVSTEAWESYDLSVKSSNVVDGLSVEIKVNDYLQLSATYPVNTVTHSVRREQALGHITLFPGENTIRFTAVNGAAVIETLTLKKRVNPEDIEGDSAEFSVNINNVYDKTHADQTNSSATYMTLQRGHYFEYALYTQAAQNYAISVNSGGNKDGVLLTVSVNGCVQLFGAYPNVTDGYQAWADQSLGIITLSPGKNVIRFLCPSDSADAVVIKSFTLTKTSDIREDLKALSTTFPLNTNTVDVSHAKANLCSTSYVTLYSVGQYVEYHVSTKKAGRYAVSVKSGGKQDGVSLDVLLDGTLKIEDAKFQNTGDYQNWAQQNLGVVALSEGDNTLRFERGKTSTNAIVIQNFVLTSCEDTVTAENGEAVASVYFDKAESGKGILALYNGDMLVKVSSTDIAFTSYVNISIEYEGEVTEAKVFLWKDTDSCEPLAACKTFSLCE